MLLKMNSIICMSDPFHVNIGLITLSVLKLIIPVNRENSKGLWPLFHTPQHEGLFFFLAHISFWNRSFWPLFSSVQRKFYPKAATSCRFLAKKWPFLSSLRGKNSKKPHNSGVFEPATCCRFKFSFFLYALPARSTDRKTERGKIGRASCRERV